MGHRTIDREIAFRAAECVAVYAKENHIPKYKVAERMGLSRYRSIYDWKSGITVPGVYALQGMAMLGLDVRYILTGRKNG